MERSEELVQLKTTKKIEARKSKESLLKKIDPETARQLSVLKEKANKKPFGRKVRESEIMAIAIKRVTASDIVELQESTFSEQDRLKLAHDEYQKRSGKLTLDQFVGKLLRGEINAPPK